MNNLAAVFLAVISGVSGIFGPSASREIVSPIWGVASSGRVVAAETAGKKTETSPGIASAVEQALKQSQGKYYVYVKNLKSGETYSLNDHTLLPAGSLYKAWLAVETLDLIRQGKIEEDEVLSAKVADLNAWAGLSAEEAELTEGGMTFTVREAVQRMIAGSHNYAAYLLTRKVGETAVRTMLRKHGLTESSYKRPPLVTAFDMGLFFEKVYDDEFFSVESATELKDIFAANELNLGLPKYLPKTVRVEHKTGELWRYKHDCGIVYSSGGNYVICAMSESGDPLGAQERIARISKNVYDYFIAK